MRNRDKYQLTNDAIEAWDKYHDGGGDMPFDVWLECEYEEPREKTLLEAAEAVTDEWYDMRQNINCNDIGKLIVDLEKAIAREKAKPVRNCDKYMTAKDASIAFAKMCEGTECEKCCYNNSTRRAYGCRFAWIYSEVGKEARNEE